MHDNPPSASPLPTHPGAARIATAHDVTQLVATLVAAFDDDPILGWFLRQDGRRSLAYGEFFRLCLIMQTLPYGAVFITDDHQATALATPPGKWQLSLAKQLAMLPQIGRCAGWQRVRRALYGFAQMERWHPQDRHYYIAFVGVTPTQRGRGRASAVLRPILARADSEGVGTYLENTQEKNLAIYQHLGFRVTGMIDLGETAPPYWSMWRDPNP